MNQTTRNLLVWGAIFAVFFSVFQLFPGANRKQQEINVPYSEFVRMVDQGNVKEIYMKGPKIFGSTKDARAFSTYGPSASEDLLKSLKERDVRVTYAPSEKEVSYLQIFFSWLPFLVLMGLLFFSFRQMKGGGNNALGFGKSKAKLWDQSKKKVTFDDVAGIDEAKSDLEEVVDFLKDPQKFQRLGGKIPRGLLLVGPPGTGKTLLARSIAGEADVPFFSISGSDFVEMFVGVGASRVRDMFEQAKKNAPCIVFIDEIDAVGRHRGAGMGGGNDEREQTLNQLLVEMDGFEENQGIILVAATNRPDILDPALLRPGRFDRQVVVPNPDVAGREKILKVHIKKVPLSSDVNLKVIARGTPGFSGADLANLVNEAALLAARQGKLAVSHKDFEQAKDKVMMGAERRSMAMTEEEKKVTAYHEAGHAIVAYYTPDSDPIHKATIVPRGRALGMVMRLPEGDRISMSLARLKADIKVAMGGRIAEELFFGKEKVTTGASSDIQMATDVARKMITQWGLSEGLGFQNYSTEKESFLGNSSSQGHVISEETMKTIDHEVHTLLETSYDQTVALIKKKKSKLEKLAKALLEFETLTGEEITALLDKNKAPTRSEEDEIVDVSAIPTTSV